MNNENEFRKLIIKSSNREGMHLIDIPDEGKRMMAINPELAHLIIEKPYDMGILYNGTYCGIELKNENASLSFNTSNIAPHQIKNLLRSVECGGLGVVLVRFKKGLSKKDRLRLNSDPTDFSIDKTYILDVEWLEKLETTSLPIELLEEECQELPYSKYSKEYDLTAIWQTTIN